MRQVEVHKQVHLQCLTLASTSNKYMYIRVQDLTSTSMEQVQVHETNTKT